MLWLIDFCFVKYFAVTDDTFGKTFTACGVAAYMVFEVVCGVGYDECVDWFLFGMFIVYLFNGMLLFGMKVMYKTYELICRCDLFTIFRGDVDFKVVVLVCVFFVVNLKDCMYDVILVK